MVLDESTRVMKRCVSCKQVQKEALHGVLGRRSLDAVKVELWHVLPRTWVRRIVFPVNVKELITTKEQNACASQANSKSLIKI